MTDILLSADAEDADSPHYLRALTDMADRRTVVAGAAIYTDNGTVSYTHLTLPTTPYV